MNKKPLVLFNINPNGITSLWGEVPNLTERAMKTLAEQFEEEPAVNISPEADLFWQQCNNDKKIDVVVYIQEIKALLNQHEMLCVMGWIELYDHQSAIVLFVIDRSINNNDRYRLMISFNAPSYQFCCADSQFPLCVTKDEKWRSLMGVFVNSSSNIHKAS